MMKFRAWDKTDKKMICWEQMRSEFTFEYFEDENFVFMQATGLFDDTGQEIFEGDVVLVVSEEFGPDTAIVKSDNFGFYLEYLDMDIFPERLNELKLEIKVVCNIYENPDLLEVTDD